MTNQDSRITDTSKIDGNIYKFFNSGLHETPFFTKINNIAKDDEVDLIRVDYEKFRWYYKQFYRDEDNYINKYIWSKVPHFGPCFQPLIYNEDIAYICKLIPFQYRGLELLVIDTDCAELDFSPRLDAYQALTHGTIDRSSKLFTEKKFFARVAGLDLTHKVLRKIPAENKVNSEEIAPKNEFEYSSYTLKTSCNEVYMEAGGVCSCLSDIITEYLNPQPEYYRDYDGLYTNDWEDDFEGFYDDRYNWLESIKFQLEYEAIDYERLNFDKNLFVEYLNQNNFDIKDSNQSLYTIFYRKIMNSALLCIPAKEHNKEIAYKCGLIPFYYAHKRHKCNTCLKLEPIYTRYYTGKYLLMLEKSAEGNIDLSPKFDAYQALTSGTIDPNSKLFKDRAYFEQVVGVDLTKEVLAAISQS